jgi:hypothetical protein
MEMPDIHFWAISVRFQTQQPGSNSGAVPNEKLLGVN